MSATGKKRLLARYVELINKRVEPFQATAFEILSARDHLYRKLLSGRELVEQLLIPPVVKFTRSDLAQTEQFLGTYSQHLAVVLRSCSDISRHPWGWVAKVLNPVEEERLVDLLENLSEALAESDEIRSSLENPVGIRLDKSADGLAHAAQLMPMVPENCAGVIQGLLAPCRDTKIREALLDFSREVEGASAARKFLEAATTKGNPEVLLQEQTADEIRLAHETLQSLGLEHVSGSHLQQMVEMGKAAELELTEAETSFRDLQTLLGSEMPFCHRNAELLLNCLRALERAPVDVLHLRSEAFEAEGVSRIIQEGAAKASALRQRHDALKGTFDLAFAKMIGPDGLKQRAGVFEGATLWKVWFGRAFRSANRDYRRIAPRSQKVAHDAIARNLRALADHFGERTQFERDAAYRDALGVNFQGIESGWDAMQRLAAWYEEVFTLLPERDEETKALRSILLVTRVDRLRDTRARLDTFARERAILERLPESISMVARALPLPVSLSMPVAEILASLRQFNGQVEEVLALLHRIDLKEAVALDCIPDLIRESESYRGSADRIDSDLQMKELLGSHFVGMETELEPIRRTVAFAEGVVSCEPTRPMADWILSDHCADRIEQLLGWLLEAALCAEKLANIGEDIDAIASSTLWRIRSQPFEELRQRMELALANRNELSGWIEFLRVRDESRDRGLEKLTCLAESNAIAPRHVIPTFKYCFYNTIVRSLFVDHEELPTLSGVTQEPATERVNEPEALPDEPTSQEFPTALPQTDPVDP